MSKYSYSRLRSFLRCNFQYYLSYVLELDPWSSKGQHRGSAGHKALEVYYGGSRDGIEALQAAWDLYSQAESIDQKDWDLLEIILKRYFEWASQNDDFEVVKTEYKFDLDIEGFHFTGFIDGIVQDKYGQIWLLEHKFNKRVSTNHLDLDPQVSTYMLASILDGVEPTGVFYNIIRVSDGPTAKKEPVVRKRIFRSVEGLNHFVDELVLQMKQAQKFEQNPEPQLYRNLTADCSWQCSYLDICRELNESGDANYLIDRFPRKDS